MANLLARSWITLIVWLKLCLMIYLIPTNESPESGPTPMEYNFPNDEQHLIDFGNFSYIMEQAPCDAVTKGLIVVHTAPSNHEKRSVIRETWGGVNAIDGSPLRLIFALGSISNSSLETAIVEEQAQYGDLLQGNFVDTYSNITYKHVMALKWFNSHCNNAQFLLKVDDDIFVNTRVLVQNLNEVKRSNERLDHLLQQRRELLLCSKVIDDRVIRSYRSKWRVSFREYSGSHYPDFCPGFTVLYSPDVAKKLYAEAQRSPYFRLDDVHITGILSKRLHISISDLRPYVLYPVEMESLLDEAEKANEQVEFLVSWHNLSPTQMRSLWSLFGNN
ncbi:beta-1,3-galactosyltransferase 5-like [Drosophila guanche]|uniref:Hexosyltransferase n=1 Tax=Drosophila guanche TaxID=7266 RepID=A0A3B0JGH7_DROGU|nr:beta-1,3-galactosyltransferase 5-like [Drosophila guanche]SPP81457.1 blast:Beta-1%2C3-galactosyltransferase 5 [Drosophila guanche]